MSCILSIVGKNFKPEDFILKSGLTPYKIRHKGDPVFITKPKGRKLDHSLISIETSNAEFNNLQKQIKDTISYLKKNKKALFCIKKTKEIEAATLDFGIDLRIDRNKILSQSDRFPNELLKLAGEIGLDIELSVYPTDMGKILEERFVKRKSKTNSRNKQ